MTMPKSYRRFGIDAHEAHQAEAFESWARGAGWTQEMREDFLATLQRAHKDPRGLDRIVDWVDSWNLPDETVIALEDCLRSLPRSAAAPSPEQDAARMAEIRSARRRYANWHDPEAALEERLILERLGGDGGGAAEKVAQLAPLVGGRLAEIRQLCRDNPEKYDSDKALQAEHRQLLTPSPGPSSSGVRRRRWRRCWPRASGYPGQRRRCRSPMNR
jgi:hypothetical protein